MLVQFVKKETIFFFNMLQKINLKKWPVKSKSDNTKAEFESLALFEIISIDKNQIFNANK